MPAPSQRPFPTDTPRRPRHLLDPDDIRASHQRSIGTMESLTRVQHWVMSVLAVTTMLHLAAGAAVVAVFLEDQLLPARIGLNVLAAFIGVLAVAVARLIHRRSLVSWWLLIGLVPGVVGAAFTFA